jgi:hypothetical protein
MPLAILLVSIVSCTAASSGRTAAPATGIAPAQPAAPVQSLSANDVSWLFPPPQQAADLDKLIAVGDLATPNAQDPTRRDPVWAAAAFQQFVAIAGSPATQVGQSRIGLPVPAQSIGAWFVAGVRIDAGAPGLSSDVRSQFGQSPEIRLIIQPVTRDPDGTPHPLDIAGHLIFDFRTGADSPAQPGCFPRPSPDLTAVKTMAAELADLRSKLGDGTLGGVKVTTAAAPLGVHPGLANTTTAASVRQEMKAFLERHLSAQRLGSMAIMGVPAGAPAPWIFLAMLNVPPGTVAALPNGGFVPVHGPTLDGQQFAQMLTPVNTNPRVVPAPHTNNLNPITCSHAALVPNPLPVAGRNGSSTADLFVNPPPAAAKAKEVLDRIVDPTASHFFNTDCVSCHTETRRAMTLLNVTDVPGIDPGVLPNGEWNVRNFGWSPAIEGTIRGTVTRRTAAETAAVLAFINSQILGR